MTADMQDIQDLEAVKQLRARYTRAIDTKDWDDYRQTLTDDFTMDSGGGARAARSAMRSPCLLLNQ
jgi:hypothetical protein